MVLDRLTDEVKQEVQLTMLFYIVTSDSREQVEFCFETNRSEGLKEQECVSESKE